MKSDRIIVINEKNDSWMDRCDLCDEINYPMLGWHCTHDDPAHGTTICHECLRDLGTILI